VGALLSALRAERLLDQTLVLVAGDHGESLGRHGEQTHSIFCYESTLRVPLFVRDPGGQRDVDRGVDRVGGLVGRRSDALVSLVDVFPTFVEALQLGDVGDVDGQSLFRRAVDPGRGAYFESYAGHLAYGWRPIAGWIDAHGKYIHGSPPQYLDPRQDPDETHDLLPGAGLHAARARAAISALARRRRLSPGAHESVDAATREQVRALGYAGVSDPSAKLPEPLAEQGLPDPRGRLHELQAYYRATALGARGDYAEALPLLQAMIADNPHNVLAITLLGAFQYKLGQYREAIATLESIPAGKRDQANVREFLGHSYERLGEYDQALEQYRLALELKPGDAHHLQDVARVTQLQAAGRGSER
ncbi:MAG: hypothetical protein DRQ55_11935, partial [Planctomycetota bacterium]